MKSFREVDRAPFTIGEGTLFTVGKQEPDVVWATCMNDRAELRRIWRQNWLNCLREFADHDIQRKWLDTENRNPHWSYVECMCSYFDDTLAGQGYDWTIADGLVTDQEAAAVTSLHHLLDNHKPPGGDQYDHERILNDQAWHEIIDEAKRSLRNLAALLNDPTEKAILSSV
jgi:hypothetical protein